MKLKLLTLGIISFLATTAFAGPIHDAAKGGDLAVVQAELDKGVDVNASGNNMTPLHWAARYDHWEIAELLIDNGADVLLASPMLGGMWAPLHVAAWKGHKEVAELLIAKGADVNAKGRDGWTPLHEAAKRQMYTSSGQGHKEIAELLIAKGADVNVIDVNGKTPLDLAEEVSEDDSPEDKAVKKEIADLLRKHGGKTTEELALMPRLEYVKDRWPFGFSFNAKDGMTYVVEVTQDFKQWGELETIEGTGKRVKFIDPRQPLVQFKRNFYRVKVVE
jgi:ankyrin repeat protein